jgi:hypothetical protein
MAEHAAAALGINGSSVIININNVKKINEQRKRNGNREENISWQPAEKRYHAGVSSGGLRVIGGIRRQAAA